MSGVVQGLIASLVSAAGAVTDTFFRYVSLLLNTSSTNGAQNNTFLDGSANAFSITRNGNTTQGTFSPFSQTGWSNYFDGTGDYLEIADNASLDLGTSDFTIEAWFFTTSTATQTIVGKWGNTTQSWYLGFGTGYGFYIHTGSVVLALPLPSVTANQWNHIAVSRSGADLKLFVNGTQSGSTYNISTSTITDTTNPVRIGADSTSGGSLNPLFIGYISNLRIVKGTAVYTSNFTPPTTPLTAITNTSLLTCQSNRFIDNSSNAFAITRNGDVSVQAFSPFSPTAAWSASTNGGSGYFDGTGDYLTTPTNAAFTFGTGDFTVECWVNSNSTNYGIVVTWRADGFSGPEQDLMIFYTGAVQWRLGGTALITGTKLIYGAGWTHIAVVKSSGNTKLYINGTQDGSTYADSNNYPAANTTLKIGYQPNLANDFNGYMASFRIVKGTAVYTSNFTPPTSPLTAITNTSLLLNFTNAGIYDSASGNDLETVGNAQVSTVQAKWGTTSMAFDGTGDWLFQIDRPTLRLGAGDFTIEGWVYLNAAGVAYGLISKGTATTGWSVNITAGNKLQFSYTATQLTGATSLAATTWYYFAVVRSGSATGNLKLYLNGAVDATSAGAVTDNFSGTDVMYIGADRTAGSNFNGYLDDVRITNGYARTISTPTAAFPVQ